MAKAFVRLPQPQSFELPFENQPFCGVTISGAVEVSYEDTGKWWLSDAWIFTLHDVPRRIHLTNGFTELRELVIDTVGYNLGGNIEDTVEEILEHEYDFAEAA